MKDTFQGATFKLLFDLSGVKCTRHLFEAGTSISFHFSDEYTAAADICVISSDSLTLQSQKPSQPAELISSPVFKVVSAVGHE